MRNPGDYWYDLAWILCVFRVRAYELFLLSFDPFLDLRAFVENKTVRGKLWLKVTVSSILMFQQSQVWIPVKDPQNLKKFLIWEDFIT